MYLDISSKRTQQMQLQKFGIDASPFILLVGVKGDDEICRRR